MTVEDYVAPGCRGYSDPTWIRSDGAFVAHPTFSASDPVYPLYATNDSPSIAHQVFGASITVEEDPIEHMEWVDGFGNDLDPRSVRLESPLRPYLSTLPQPISLLRPFTAEWFSDATTSSGTASSADHTGYHAGPSGQPLHHINLGHDLTPTPGGPSHDLTDALWRAGTYYVEGHPLSEPDIDPNIVVTMDEYMINLVFALEIPGTVDAGNFLRLTVECESPGGTFDLLTGAPVSGWYSFMPNSYVWTIDDIFRMGDTFGIDPNGCVLNVYDHAYWPAPEVPRRLMGTINPGWSAGTIATYEHYVVDNGPKMTATTMDHTLLLDFFQSGGIS